MPLSALGDTIADTIMLALGIVLDAGPFLLLGAVAAGLVEVFVPDGELARLAPRGRVPAALAGIALGMLFPVGESGAIPLARRLMRKGLPAGPAVALLLAAPVLNPLMLAALGVALGWGGLLALRVAAGLLLALGGGIAAGILWPDADATVRTAPPGSSPASAAGGSLGASLQHALRIAGDEFVALAPYLLLAAFVAAVAQMLAGSAPALAGGSSGPAAVPVAPLLALLNAGSPLADARTAAQLGAAAPASAVAAFLISGAVLDLKNLALYLSVLRGRVVLLLAVLALAVALSAGYLAEAILGVLL